MATGAEFQKVPKEEVLRFCQSCMKVAGSSLSHGKQLAEVLMSADYRGHFSHGLNRLHVYVRDVQLNATCRDGAPEVLKETAATAWVDGKNLLGAVVGNYCMDLAIKKAKEAGIGWVVAKGSNHYGISGWYTLKALEHNLLGMSMTNSSPITVPNRAKKQVFGTNPISLSAPSSDGQSFVLDMATSTVSFGKIEMQNHKNEPIPAGWGVDAEGHPTTDPKDVVERKGSLQPLGGPEITGGYKGTGIMAMIEILTAVLSGGAVAGNVRQWLSTAEEANLGQLFVAINPECFAMDFEGRLADFLGCLRDLEPSSPDLPVVVAGDLARQHMKQVDEDGAIPYPKNLLISLNSRWSLEPSGLRPVLSIL
ncbi:uncharacterized oxidoreductase YjmC-like isoform X2 [Apostichopus japonicus]|uniref:uncharacterized oxidoreductase YjmC-like isoform X2 n=1 Tax=Stichopus japonicus TaxID=307972 RepID=UPI003AB25E9A